MTAQETCCRTLAVTPPESAFTPTKMMHKGLVGWRYDARSNYMITLVTEPRRNVFGTVREWGVERSEAGKVVYEAWQEIGEKFPVVRATYNMIMPDHFHGIVYVTEAGVVDLGEVVQFFAERVERRLGYRVWCSLWRDSICLGKGQLHRQIEYVLSNAKRRWVKEQNPDLFRKQLGLRHWRLRQASAACAAMGGADSWDFLKFTCDPGAECWSLTSGDEIVKPRKGNQIVSPFGREAYVGGERQQAYDNKERQQADNNQEWRRECGGKGVQTCCRTLAVSPRDIDWAAMGNPFLLDGPLLVSTRISTAVPPNELAHVVTRIVEKAMRGAVIVSPFVSPGEKAARNAVLEAGGSVVRLMAEGMGRYFKPGGQDFDLCAEGRLLLLSPFQPSQGGAAARENYGKPRFEWLNLAAKNMADLAIGWARKARVGHASANFSVK